MRISIFSKNVFCTYCLNSRIIKMHWNIISNSIGKLLTILSMIISLKLAVIYLGVFGAGYWENQLTIISIIYLLQSSAGVFFTYQFNKDKNVVSIQNWIEKSYLILSFQGILILAVLYFLSSRFISISFIKENEVFMFWTLVVCYTITSITEVYVSLLNASGLAGKVAIYQGVTNFVSLVFLWIFLFKFSNVFVFAMTFLLQRFLFSLLIVMEIRKLGFSKSLRMNFLSKKECLYFLDSYKFLFFSIVVVLCREQLLKIIVGSVNDKTLILNYSTIIKIQTILFVIPSFLSNPVGAGLANKFLDGDIDAVVILFKKAQFILSMLLSLAVFFIIWNMRLVFIFLLGKSTVWIEQIALVYLIATVFIIFFTSTISIFSKYIGWMKTEFEYIIINLLATCLLFFLYMVDFISLNKLITLIPIIWLFSSLIFMWRFKKKSGFRLSTFFSSVQILFICTILPVFWYFFNLNISAIYNFIFSIFVALIIICSHANQLKPFLLGLKSR